MTAFDRVGFEFLNRAAFISPTLDTAIIFVAHWLAYWVVAAFIVWLLAATLPRWRREYLSKTWEMGIVAFGSALIARFGIVEAIRLFYDRPRPFEVLTDLPALASQGNFLLQHQGGGSFPSGHATFFFALAAGITPYYPRTSIVFYVAAAAISISRVIGGIHWPSDIIAGALVGILTSIICRAFLKKYRNPKTAA